MIELQKRPYLKAQKLQLSDIDILHKEAKISPVKIFTEGLPNVYPLEYLKPKWEASKELVNTDVFKENIQTSTFMEKCI